MRRLLLITTAMFIAGKDIALLVFYLITHLVTGHFTEEAKRRAWATRLWTITQATGTERKVMIFEYLVYGPIGEALGAGEVMTDIFGAITEPDDPDETLSVLLATRYDEEMEAAFYLEAILDPEDHDGEGLEYMTIFTPLGSAGDSAGGSTGDYSDRCRGGAFYAAWPDSTMALISYYGNGSSEIDAVGFELGPEDRAEEDSA